MRIAAFDPKAPRRAMFGHSDALLLLFNDPAVGDEVAGIELNLDLVLGLAHLDAAANPGDWNGVAVGMQRNVALDIDGTLMQPVDLGNPDLQRLQLMLLDGEQLAGNRVEVFLKGRVDAIAPPTGLQIYCLTHLA